jgi:hypothetical protein
LFVSSLLNAEDNRTDNRNLQVNRNSKETENWQGNDQDIDKQEEEEYSSDDEEGMVDGGAIEENGGISGNRGRCVSTEEAGGSGEISSVITSGTKVTDMDSFWQHETIMPDIEKATKDIASVVGPKLFKSTKFPNRSQEMYKFKPERDNEELIRRVFYCFLCQECKHQGEDDGIWWAAVQKEVHKSIAKKKNYSYSSNEGCIYWYAVKLSFPPTNA